MTSTTDAECIDYMRRNAPLLPRTKMAELLGMRVNELERTCKKHGIELLPIGIPAGADDLANGAPPGFELNLWLRGTTMRYPTATPGYRSITIHIADDDGDDEDLGPQEKATKK